MAYSDLTVQVSKKLNANFLSLSTKSLLNKTETALNEANKQYLYSRLVCGNILEFLELKAVNEPPEASLSTNSNELNALNSRLYLNVIKQCLSLKSKNDLQLFGITEEFIDGILSSRKKSNLQKAELNEFIKDKIDALSKTIVDYARKIYADQFWNNNFSVVMQKLFRELDRLAENDAIISSNEAAVENMILTYHKTLSEGITVLNKLIGHYIKKLEFDSSLSDMLLNKGSTLALKTKRFEYDVLKETYRKQNMEALKKINEQLDEKRSELERILFNTNGIIEKYQLLGPQYEALVQKYAELLTTIKEERWAVNCIREKHNIEPSISEINVSIENSSFDMSSELNPANVTGELNPANISGELNPANISGELNPANISGELNPANISGELNPVNVDELNPANVSDLNSVDERGELDPVVNM